MCLATRAWHFVLYMSMMGRRHEKSALVRILEVAGNGASGCASVRLTLRPFQHMQSRISIMIRGQCIFITWSSLALAKPIPSSIHYVFAIFCGMILAWFGSSDHSVCIRGGGEGREGSESDSIFNCPSLCASSSIIHSHSDPTMAPLLICMWGLRLHKLHVNTFCVRFDKSILWEFWNLNGVL